MLIRRIALSGDYADADWTDPANTPPDNLRRIKVLAPESVFAIEGKVDASEGAGPASVGTLTVDAWLGTLLPAGGIARGESVVEAKGSPLKGQVMLVASDLVPGTIAVLNLALTNVGALAAVDVRVLRGARVL